MVQRAEVGAGVADVDLSDRTALVTGSTRGVGREVARAFARLGADVVIHGRDRERGRAVADELDATFLGADFTSMDAVRDLAAEIDDGFEALDLLVNNAGTHFDDGELTDVGVERTFAVNHLAPFLLTNLLRSTLADDGRVVTVSSEVHRRASVSDVAPAAVTSVADYDGFDAYARSKLANVLFTRELARRLDGPTANCCHPGFVPRSGLWRDAPLHVAVAVGFLERLPQWLVGRFVDTPVEAAETPTYLAASPDVADVTGAYFRDCERVEPSDAARDDEAARRLWKRSAEWTGLDAA